MLSMSLKIKLLSHSNLCDFYDFISSQIKTCSFVGVFLLQITSEDISLILIYIVLTSIICSVINLPCQNNTTQNFLIISKCENEENYCMIFKCFYCMKPAFSDGKSCLCRVFWSYVIILTCYYGETFTLVVL